MKLTIQDIKLFAPFMIIVSLRLAVFFSKLDIKGSSRLFLNATFLSILSMFLIPIYSAKTSYYWFLYYPLIFIVLAFVICMKKVKREKATEEALSIYKKLKLLVIEVVVLVVILIIISNVASMDFF